MEMDRMRRSHRFYALCAVVVVAVAAVGNAAAASAPSATASQSLVAGSPAAIACGGTADALVTINGQAGTSGQSTDVMLVLDISGSIGTPSSKFAQLKQAAADTIAALDAADGSTDQTISGNNVGIEYYHDSTATIAAPIGSSYSALTTALANLPSPEGSTPQDVAITTAANTLAADTSGNAKAMVLVTDGQADGSDLTNATNAATAAKTSGITIVPFGIGTGSDVNVSNLQTWASDPASYQAATPGPIDQAKAVSDLGAAVATPVNFTLTETLGSNFSAAALSSSTGSVSTAPGSLTWTGTLTGTQSATLGYRATRNGTDVFSSTSEVVSTMSLAVAGGTATVSGPASISTTVLPCGGSLVAATTCTGSSCTASGTTGGQQVTVNAGNAAPGTSVILAGLSTQPPAGVCSGFDSSTSGVEFDISPFTADATFSYVIPKASLGKKLWWQTEVCLGTNLKFTTQIGSFANLRPGAKLVSGGTLPSRWWGLLPSLPRLTFIQGLGFVRGPWITSRSVDKSGNAHVTFVVPFVPNSAAFTTDGKPGYDPKRWA
jgi:hypothetical protein